jgi:hypothetical protein
MLGPMNSQEQAEFDKVDFRGKWDQVRASAQLIGVDLTEYRNEGGCFTSLLGRSCGR